MILMDVSAAKTIVVLSGGLTNKHTLPFFVKSRLDHAYKLYHLGNVSTIVVSGKWSFRHTHPIPVTEAELMKHYLVKLGIPEKKIKKEEESQDMLSSAYFLKKNICIPKGISNAVIICSDFEEQRVRYVFHKVFGDLVELHFIVESSQLKSEVMWQFFAHERSMLLDTKAFLRKMENGDHSFLDSIFYSKSLYEEKKVGKIKVDIYGRKIDKRKTAKAHYSLVRILKKRKQIYEKYTISIPVKKTLTADFWSGRFLNFLGKDSENNLYSLKFVLYVKDKKTFANEVKISEYLTKSGIDFIPTIVGSGYDKAPAWYLYRIVKGKMSGSFSYTFSFNDSFYQSPGITKLFAHHLRVLRELSFRKQTIPTWTSSIYKRRMSGIYKRINRHSDGMPEPIIVQAYELFRKKSIFLNNTNVYLSHADLHPANIIYSKNKLFFIDFEHISYANSAFDFCFGYVFSWNNRVFQEKLLSAFRKSLTEKERVEFEFIFPLVYVYFILWLYAFTLEWEYKSGKENAQEARNHLINELKKYLPVVSAMSEKKLNKK